MNTVPDELVTDFNNALERANDDLMGMQTRAYERGVQDGKAEAEHLIAKLPLTKDGVSVVPGMVVYPRGSVLSMRVDAIERHGDEWLLRRFGVATHEPDDCYSTSEARAAAHAAGGK